ncbi:hypothetical protein SsS58_07899 [Streptomyces scabiei]|uniref:Uncharacterized protein n=1 Tax=Streptomyces scabiei TaxID=1930 RepID=A0A100JXE3_STRSC|nr:hypothetical protein SsS58_07899 [Streptomyces scabiei]
MSDEMSQKEQALRSAVIRRSCVAGAAVLSLTLLTACSDSGESGEKGGSGGGKPALSAADLEKVVLKDGDVKGHKVSEPNGTVDRKTIEPGSDACAPVAYAMLGSVVDEPAATVQRETQKKIDPVEAAKSGDASGLDATRTLLRLSAYDGEAARAVMKSLTASAEDCADGFEVTADGTSQQVTKVTTDPAPEGADEAIALTFLSEAEGTKVPMKVVVFRQGATVGYVTALNLASAATGKDFDFPAEVVEAQVKKLA